jgi:hypothetical protein
MKRAALAAVAAVLALLALASCRIEGKRSAYSSVGADAEALRAAFNGDTGRVRVVVLVAPT